MNREKVLSLMNEILTRGGHSAASADDESLRDLGFRSLDFSELALRVEDDLGYELNFDAPELRAITTVGDVLDFFERAQSPGDAAAS